MKLVRIIFAIILIFIISGIFIEGAEKKKSKTKTSTPQRKPSNQKKSHNDKSSSATPGKKDSIQRSRSHNSRSSATPVNENSHKRSSSRNPDTSEGSGGKRTDVAQFIRVVRKKTICGCIKVDVEELVPARKSTAEKPKVKSRSGLPSGYKAANIITVNPRSGLPSGYQNKDPPQTPMNIWEAKGTVEPKNPNIGRENIQTIPTQVPKNSGETKRTVETNKLNIKRENIQTISSEDYEYFKSVILKRHNYFRSLHGFEPMVLSEPICQFSQEWAEYLAGEGKDTEHRPNKPYGENIYDSGGNLCNGLQTVDYWYTEIANFRFDEFKLQKGTGHFTQVIWKDSKKLGVGIAQHKESLRTYVVTNYDPPGNYNTPDEIRLNIKPALKTAEPINFPIRNFFPTSENPTNNPQSRVLAVVTPEELRKFKNGMLTKHNDYRRMHATPDLSLNETMCNHAQQWADHLAREGNRALFQPDSPYGQNTCTINNVVSDGLASVDSWYARIDYFNFDVKNIAINQKATLFTQVIWYTTRQLGVGIARNDLITYTVAFYYPAGNLIVRDASSVEDNVKSPISTKARTVRG